MWRSPERSWKPTTPVAPAVIVLAPGDTAIRIRIAMRALFAREVRAAEAASSTPGFGALECVEAGGADVWFACACPQAVAPASTTRTVRKRNGRTSLVVAVNRRMV
jgi:hypothetical protein